MISKNKKLTTMIKTITFAFLIFVSVPFEYAQEIKKTEIKQLVEAACGQCQFGMKDKKGCDLAVRIDGKSYFVEGSKIDDHGDAHAKNGMCAAIRIAQVSGAIVSGNFLATSFLLIPTDKKTPLK